MITFEEKVEAMIMFNRQIGERKAAEFAVRLDDVVENLGRNNESFVQAFREMLAAEQCVQRICRWARQKLASRKAANR